MSDERNDRMSIKADTLWTDEYICKDARRFGQVRVTDVSDTGITFQQETILLHMKRKDFERWFEPCRPELGLRRPRRPRR
jgi:hypothetical protein